MTIEEQMRELTRKADAAQRAGNYELMREYDEQLEQLKAANFKLMQQVYEEDQEETKKRGK